MAMVIDAAVLANHKNDTKNYSDTYVKRSANCFRLIEFGGLI